MRGLCQRSGAVGRGWGNKSVFPYGTSKSDMSSGGRKSTYRLGISSFLVRTSLPRRSAVAPLRAYNRRSPTGSKGRTSDTPCNQPEYPLLAERRITALIPSVAVGRQTAVPFQITRHGHDAGPANVIWEAVQVTLRVFQRIHDAGKLNCLHPFIRGQGAQERSICVQVDGLVFWTPKGAPLLPKSAEITIVRPRSTLHSTATTEAYASRTEHLRLGRASEQVRRKLVFAPVVPGFLSAAAWFRLAASTFPA